MEKRVFLKNWILLLVFVAAAASPTIGQIIYVDEDAAGLNDGSSWEDAYTDLQDALADARGSGSPEIAIWVAAGTYKPTTDESDLSATFEMVEGVTMYGGFAGGETDPNQRNFTANVTTLTGDLDDNTNTQGCARTVTCDDLDEGTLDGFTVTEGWTSGIACDSSDITVKNCKIIVNTDGIYIHNSSAPDVNDCTFENNYGYDIRCYDSQTTINNCNIDGKNRAPRGLYCIDADVVMNDCTVKNHTSDGITAYGSTLTINQGTIEKNNYGTVVDHSNLTINQSFIEHSRYAGVKATNYSAVEIKNTTTRFNDRQGIYCMLGSDVNVVDCNITDNEDDGIHAIGSDIMISDSIIKNNEDDGIIGEAYLKASSCIIQNNGNNGIVSKANLTVNNCVIEKNADKGIVCMNATTSVINIKNNLICDNGNGSSDHGIYLSGYGDLVGVTISNNTIANNGGIGIATTDYPDTITNCIIWGNGNGGLQYPDYNVTYSCVQDGYGGEGNIDTDPSFIDDANGNYHLTPGSDCIDAGDPAFDPDPGETDIDGETRIKYGRVDMGADEYYWSPADFDENQLVNFIDYAFFASAWQSSLGQANYNDIYDLDDTNSIDYDDLDLFCEDWLWVPKW